ncbi:GNAT family N-acetyltransferase [Pseudomonas sp. Q11]|uniref:GNAT family N-acetyltransferase n=1 Tax=Pseudomonas sp. Q11 TaxID=2968470 RepID=UPI00210D170F|nr:GNAT family N-acetyltransferase [Pseudomonas sp. Q11]MCQ6255363.1 GNAT family N-acetyltransferase [Pseudomonas sp. Q11]
MKWPTIDEVRGFTPLPEDYEWDYLERDEISVAISFLETWFPSISVGTGSAFFNRLFYEEKVVFSDCVDRDILAVVVRHQAEIVAIATWEKIDGADVIYGRVGAVARPHRKSNLAIAAQHLGEKIGKHMGAGLIYGMATTTSPYMQQALEQAGYTAVGIMPGFDREEREPGVVHRVYEVIYAKPLADPSDFIVPIEQNLTPNVSRLYAQIFKSDTQSSTPIRSIDSVLTSVDLVPASAADIPDVVSLLNRAYRGDGDEGGWTTEAGLISGDRISQATLRAEIAEKPHATLLVWKQYESLLGCVWVEPMSGHTWYLGSLAVDPQTQNARFGRRLLSTAEQWCQARGAQAIHMTVLEARETLIAWYERRGYSKSGETELFPYEDSRFGTPTKPGLRFAVMTKSFT